MKNKAFWKLLSLKNSQVPSQNSRTNKIQSDPQILLLGNYLFFVILVYLISCWCHEVTQPLWSWCMIWCFAHVHVLFFFLLSLTSLVPSRSQTMDLFDVSSKRHGTINNGSVVFQENMRSSKNRQCTVQIEALWSSHVTLLFEWMEYSIRRRKCDFAFLWLYWYITHSLLKTLARAWLMS